MRILLIHQYFQELDGSGGARFNEMTKVWLKEGHEIVVIAGNLTKRSTERKKEYNGKIATKVFQDGIEIWRCFVSKNYNKNFMGRLWGYLSFVISGIFAGIFKAKGRFDIILVSSPPLFVAIIAIILSMIKRVPFVFEVRDLWPESAIDTGVIKNKYLVSFSFWFEKFTYKKAEKINVLTPAFYRNLVNKKGVPEDKLFEIPNAADFQISDDLLGNFNYTEFRELKDLNDYYVVIYIGAHGVANGLELFIETAKRLSDTNVLFLLIGHGMLKEKLVARAQEYRISNIRFLDPMPKKEVLKYVLASDIGASVLIKNDTFKTIYSNKTFDYMSCKKPILMVIDGISRELVVKADAGLFVEPENSKDFEEKLRYCLQNKQEIFQKGQNGYVYAKNNFDREYLALKYLQELQAILNKSNKANV